MIARVVGLRLGQAADRGRGLRGETGRAEHVLGLSGRADQVAGGEGRSVPNLGEEVAAEQGSGGLLVDHVGVPAVGNMGGVDAADAPAAQVDGAPVGASARVAGRRGR